MLQAGGDVPVLREIQRSDEQLAAVAGRLAFLGVRKVWQASPAAALVACGLLWWVSG